MNVAFVGAGRIAYLLEADKKRYHPCTHFGAIEKLRNKHNLVFQSICDLDLDRAQGLAKKAKAKDVLLTKKYKEAITAKTDMAIITTDTQYHCEILSHALSLGVPKIVIEKPITVNTAQANKLRKLISKTKSNVIVNYERRYLPKYMSLVDLNRLGAATSYSGFVAAGIRFLSPRKNFEGLMLHDTTHLLDLCQFIFGNSKLIKSNTKGDSNLMMIGHKSVNGTIQTQAKSKYFHFELEIKYERGRLVIGNGYSIEQKSVKSKHYSRFYSLSEPKYKADSIMNLKRNPFLNLYKAFLNNQVSNSSAIEACDNVVLLNQALKSQ